MSRRDRRAVVIGAAALGCLLLARLIVLPWMDDWSRVRQAVADDRAELAGIESSLTKVLSQRARLEKGYGQAVRAPLKDADQAQMALYDAARDVLGKGGLQPQDYQPQQPAPVRDVPGVQTLGLRIRGQCSIDQLLKCLAAMRREDTLLIVDNLSVENDEKSPGKLTVTMVLSTLARKAGSS
jgi:hypothetical protein